MSERTVIGGVSYETVGSNTSNLLLRCNGTARIQWGNKLIDLIKNGKIAGNDSLQVSIVSDESEIKLDGIYVVNKDKSLQFFVCKNGERYNLSGADLYISASTKLDFTDEQKTQIHENIGLLYKTLQDVQNANLKNGIVYVLEDKQLYTIKDGIIELFEAVLKTVTVEKENENGEVILSSQKIVLQVLELDYLVLESNQIICNKDLVLNNSQLCFQGSSETYGFRVYMNNNLSTLEVDNLRIRNNSSKLDYIEITYTELKNLIIQGKLEQHKWYLIKDFKNHWNLNTSKVRPILVLALDSSSLCRLGYLYNCKDVVINYDYNFYTTVVINELSFTTTGIITWMKDPNNNEANFDFLDYSVYDSDGKSLVTLHSTDFSNDMSIFPTGSFNNKLTVVNLYNTVITNSAFDNSNSCIVDFLFDDSNGSRMEFHDNVLSCSGSGLILSPDCSKFTNNTFGVIDNSDIISANIYDCSFKNITDCIFGQGDLTNITCRSDLSNRTFSLENDVLLYDTTKAKDIYVNSGILNITSISELLFYRGMIVMHSGILDIPEGWAVCDGGTYTFNGVESTTPNLVGRFIKAVDDVESISATDVHENNDFTLLQEHLPSHNHPHKSHTHSFSGSGSTTIKTSSSESAKEAIVSITDGTSGFSGDDVTIEDATVNISISGTTGSATSLEDTQTWANNSFKIEPNYYSLIFIMKL